MRAAVWIGAKDPSQALRSWMKVRELLSDQPPSKPIDYLRMMACEQIVNFGWREGISAEDALVYFDEAKQLALAMGDMRANALIHAVRTGGMVLTKPRFIVTEAVEPSDQIQIVL